VTFQNWTDLIKGAGGNTELPWLILNTKGELLALNRRMAELLKIKVDFRHFESFKKIPKSDLKTQWPFFDADRSAPAHLDFLLKQKATVCVAESRLKTYQLEICPLKDGKKNYTMVMAKVIRPGELLDSQDSRLALFRSLSHEIRSSVMALKGYMQMVEAKPTGENLKHMRHSIDRLEKVVERLSEFREILNILKKN